MLEWVKHHPYLAAMAIVPSTVALSEVLWCFVQRVRVLLHWRRAQINEVLMFNELGFECMQDHRAHSELGTRFQCHNPYCSERHIERIIEQLNEAKYSIDLAMYSIHYTQIVTALRKARQRGVFVRIIVSQCKGTVLNNQLADLLMNGVDVRTQNSKLFMHHKFCVVDGRARVDEICRMKKRARQQKPTCSVLINGSVNWTQGGLGANWENVVISSQTRLTNDFQAEFNRLWTIFEPKFTFL